MSNKYELTYEKIENVLNGTEYVSLHRIRVLRDIRLGARAEGSHHFAKCGEWRPTDQNRTCSACQGKCPGCGTFYAPRGTR